MVLRSLRSPPSTHPPALTHTPTQPPSISKICGLSQLPELRKSSLAIKLLVAFLGLRLLTPCFVSSPNVSNSSSRVPMRAEGEKEGEETWLQKCCDQIAQGRANHSRIVCHIVLVLRLQLTCRMQMVHQKTYQVVQQKVPYLRPYCKAWFRITDTHTHTHIQGGWRDA